MRWNLFWINSSSRKLSPRIRTVAFCIPWFGMIVSSMYVVFENYSPSPFVSEYGPFVWIPLGLAYYTFLITKCAVRDEKVSPRRYDFSVILWLPVTLYLMNSILVWGMPALANRIVGEPFQWQTVVTRKWWGSRIFHTWIEVADYKTYNGSIWSSEFLWKDAYGGDTVTISGVQSVLGRSIDSVEKVYTRVRRK